MSNSTANQARGFTYYALLRPRARIQFTLLPLQGVATALTWMLLRLPEGDDTSLPRA